MIGSSLLLSALLGCSPQAASQAPIFRPAPTSPISVGAGSGQIVLADIDGDDVVDMITRHPESHTVSFHLGDGKGGFVSAGEKTIRLNYAAAGMVFGDFDKDSILDFAVTSADRDIVDVYLGEGKARFRPAPGSPFAVSPAMQRLNKRSLQLLDVNGDGNLDLVTENGRRNELGILLGDGRGGFTPAPIVTLDAGQEGYSSSFADTDGDGRLDVVTVSTAEAEGRLVTRRGDGKRGFTRRPGSQAIVPRGARLLALARVNDDKHPDVVLSHGHSLSVLLNEGDGSFASAPSARLETGTATFGAVVRDVNGDGKADLAAATSNSITVFLGDGRGGLRAAPGSPFHAQPGAYSLTLGDVNGDGKLDVVATSFETSAVTLLLGR